MTFKRKAGTVAMRLHCRQTLLRHGALVVPLISLDRRVKDLPYVLLMAPTTSLRMPIRSSRGPARATRKWPKVERAQLPSIPCTTSHGPLSTPPQASTCCQALI